MVYGGDGRIREGGGSVEWSEKMPRINQYSKPRLGDGCIRSTCLDEFLCKMMRFVKVLVKGRNDYGWMKLEGGYLICFLFIFLNHLLYIKHL